MATIYSSQLAKGVMAAGAFGTIYTSPAAGTVIVRSVTITAQAAGSGNALLFQGGSIGIAAFRSANQYDTLTVSLRAVMLDSEALEFAAFGVGFSYHVSGYILTS